MKAHVRLPHTAAAHVPTFDGLLRELAPSLRVEHVVAEDLLTDAQRLGIDDLGLIRRVHAAMTDAAGGGAALVVCTCSTIGGLAERAPTAGRFSAARIDRAMADHAVSLGPRVLVVAALESTVGPTCGLIRESAAARGVAVDIRTHVVADAWPHFLRGEREAYLQAVERAVRSQAAIADMDTDVVVLAQASMAPAAERLRDLAVEVLASPALGARAIAAFFGL